MIPQRVLIFGGTHGNEWTGITIIEEYGEKFKRQFPELKLEFILANPQAYKINKRFKDEDLNRAFQFLDEFRPHSYEHERAKELKDLILEEPTLIIDLHSTTSHMGATVLLTNAHNVILQLARGILETMPETKIIVSPDPLKKLLVSQSPFGLLFEIGPISNGIICPKVLRQTLDLLERTFELLSKPQTFIGEIDVFEEVLDIYYPKRTSGKMAGFIHPDFQGKDFHPVNGPYKPFLNFDGTEDLHFAKEELYPIFINEAAYYPQLLAFTLCRKKRLFL